MTAAVGCHQMPAVACLPYRLAPPIDKRGRGGERNKCELCGSCVAWEVAGRGTRSACLLGSCGMFDEMMRNDGDGGD